jgi:hypothetical protein
VPPRVLDENAAARPLAVSRCRLARLTVDHVMQVVDNAVLLVPGAMDAGLASRSFRRSLASALAVEVRWPEHILPLRRLRLLRLQATRAAAQDLQKAPIVRSVRRSSRTALPGVRRSLGVTLLGVALTGCVPADGDSSDRSSATAPSASATASSPIGMADDVRIDVCDVRAGPVRPYVELDYTLRNVGDEPATYVIDFAIVDASGAAVATARQYREDQPPGEAAAGTAIAGVSRDSSGPYSCRVSVVQRYTADQDVPPQSDVPKPTPPPA